MALVVIAISIFFFATSWDTYGHPGSWYQERWFMLRASIVVVSLTRIAEASATAEREKSAKILEKCMMYVVTRLLKIWGSRLVSNWMWWCLVFHIRVYKNRKAWRRYAPVYGQQLHLYTFHKGKRICGQFSPSLSYVKKQTMFPIIDFYHGTGRRRLSIQRIGPICIANKHGAAWQLTLPQSFGS